MQVRKVLQIVNHATDQLRPDLRLQTIQRAKVGDTNAVAAALNLSEATATSYSRRLNDQWNVAGIKSNDGYPSITSHYGKKLQDWTDVSF